MPELFSELRIAIDADRSKPGRFIITGSSSPQLLKSVSESLAGRVAIIELSQPTIKDYFTIADGTFIWRTIPPYEKNATKRIVKHPKGYLRDSGLLHHFLHLNDLNLLLAHPIAGFSWESMVIENIIREFNFIGEDIQPFFVKDYKCKYGIIISNINKPVLYDQNLIGIPFGAL